MTRCRASYTTPSLALALALGLDLGFASCGSAADAPGLAELERLAFVPAGECTLVAREGPPVRCANTEALLVDRFEVSRGEWSRFLAAQRVPADEAFRSLSTSWSEETRAWPASGMTLDEARAFARSRDLRLLTAREWLRVACGTRAQPWPWGRSAARSVANTVELQLGRPVAVGTFELGQTPFSTYEMTGNVREWVEEPIVQAGDVEAPPLAWAMGGSYNSTLRTLYQLDNDGRLTFDALDIDPRTRQEDVGLRCAGEAEPYLVAHAPHWGETDAVRPRLIAIGRQWGRAAVPLLEHLCAMPRAPQGLRWLLDGARR